MPYDQRPREKLARLGPAALDNAELMAHFISTGTKGRSAIDIGRDLIARYGSMGALGGLPVGELSKVKGLGLAKASKLAAAFELGTRVAREQLQETPLETPQLISDFFGPQLRHLTQEQVVVAVLDSRHRQRVERPPAGNPPPGHHPWRVWLRARPQSPVGRPQSKPLG